MTNTELQQILMQYGVGKASEFQATSMHTFHPSPHNTLIIFVYQGKKYYLLDDYSAGNDPAYVRQEIEEVKKTRIKGSLLAKPKADNLEFETYYLWEAPLE